MCTSISKCCQYNNRGRNLCQVFFFLSCNYILNVVSTVTWINISDTCNSNNASSVIHQLFVLTLCSIITYILLELHSTGYTQVSSYSKFSTTNRLPFGNFSIPADECVVSIHAILHFGSTLQHPEFVSFLIQQPATHIDISMCFSPCNSVLKD